MRYLLDSNTCIRHLNQRSEPITRRLASLMPEDIAVCSVVKAEMLYGAYRSQNPQQTLAIQRHFLDQFISLSFDDAAAQIYGQIRARLADLGTPIGPNDLMIAAIAMAHDLVLVTHNVGEFGRIEKLKVEDWEAG